MSSERGVKQVRACTRKISRFLARKAAMFSFSCRRPLGCRAAAVATQAAVSSSLLQCSLIPKRDHTQQSEASVFAVLAWSRRPCDLHEGRCCHSSCSCFSPATMIYIGEAKLQHLLPALATGGNPHLPSFTGKSCECLQPCDAPGDVSAFEAAHVERAWLAQDGRVDSRRKGRLLAGRPRLARALLCCPCMKARSRAAAGLYVKAEH